MLFYYPLVSQSTGRLPAWARPAGTGPTLTPSRPGPASLPSSPWVPWPPRAPARPPARTLHLPRVALEARAQRGGPSSAAAAALLPLSAPSPAGLLLSATLFPFLPGFISPHFSVVSPSHVSSGKASLGPQSTSASSFISLVEPWHLSFRARYLCAIWHLLVGSFD